MLRVNSGLHDAGDHHFGRFLFDATGHVHTAHRATRPAEDRAAKDKSAALRVYFALAAVGALPQEGRPRKFVDAATHERAAMAIGYKHRSSIGRNLKKAIPIFARRKTMGGGTRFELRLPEGPQRYSKETYIAPSGHELSQVKELEHYWPQPRRRFKKAWLRGYVSAPRQIFKSSFPGGPHAKLVLAYLAHVGLLRIGKHGRVSPGEVSPQVVTIARALGLSETCVYRQLHFWADKKLLLLKHYKAHKDAESGKWVQHRMTIIWRPGWLFSFDAAVQEYARVLEATERQHGQWRERLLKIVHEVLKEWTGTARRLETAWRECERRFKDAGIPGDLVDAWRAPP